MYNETMTTMFRARVEDGKLVPEEPVDLPNGARVTVHLEDDAAKAGTERALLELLELAEQFPPNPNAPVDGAAQHDHYIHGVPKREDP